MEKKNEKPTKAKAKDKINNDLSYDPNITPEDKQALNDKGLSMDMGQDKELANRDRKVDFTGKDLDIPGREERDTSTGTGIPDEDNYQFNQRGSRPEEKKKKERPNPDRNIPKD